jgi:hypothetical protein
VIIPSFLELKHFDMRHIYTLLFFSLMANIAQGQVPINGHWRKGDTTQVHTLYTRRGDQFVGRLLEKNKAVVGFLVNADTVFFSTKSVKRIVIRRKTNLLPATMVTERLFVSPTAFPLKKGVREYRNNCLLFNSYRKGITNNMQVGIGFMPALFVNLIWVDTKVTIPIGKNINAGLGGMLGGGNNVDFISDFETFGFAAGFGALTIGTKSHFINLSSAYVLHGIKSNPENKWLYSFGGAMKIPKRKHRLYYELLYVPERHSTDINWYGTIGITIVQRKRNTDLGILIHPLGISYRAPFFGITSKK